MQKILVVALHGFLGRGADWKSLSDGLKKKVEKFSLEFWCPDLLSPQSSLHPEFNFIEWSDRLMSEIKSNSYDRVVLMGYSMGGRLAMHCLLRHPEQIDAAIFLSTNPNMLPAEEREIRLAQDNDWSLRFIKEDWQSITQAWNEQLIFQQEKEHPLREENLFSRKYLAMAMKNWSLANHVVGINELLTVKKPCLWFAGAKDNKFTAIMNYMQQKAVPAEYHILENQAHRLGFRDDPEIVQAIDEFLGRSFQLA